MPPAWWLTSILIFSHGLTLGLSYMALFGERIVDRFGAPLIGTLIGSSLAALSSTIIWILTYWKERRKDELSNQRLISALWNDIGCLKFLAYTEAEWWRKEMKDPRFGATQKRLFSNLECVVFEKNLNRIGDIPIRAADALLAVRAGTIVVRDAHKEFYENEDKIIKLHLEKKLTPEALSDFVKNKAKTFHSLVKVAADCHMALRALDPDDKLEAERIRSFTPEEWARRGKEDAEMNATLDAILEGRRLGTLS